MFSTNLVGILFAANFAIFASGFVIIPNQHVLKPILACYEYLENEEAELAKLKGVERHPYSDAVLLKLTCTELKEFDSCLAGVLEATTPPVPRVFYFYAAMMYQTMVLVRRGNLCPDATYENWKDITLKSGIMEEEGLPNIENDRYVKCAGDALKICFNEDYYRDPLPSDTKAPYAAEDYMYIQCMKKQAESCPAVIMHHVVRQLEVMMKKVLPEMESEELQD